MSRVTERAPAPARRHPRVVAIIAAAAVVAALGAACEDGSEATDTEPRVRPVAACDVPLRLLERVWQGYYPGRSGDVIAIERPPNQLGTRHSTPFAYTQDVPIVLYGPGYIRKGVEVERPVTSADIAPTLAELLGFEGFDRHEGKPLDEALLPESRRNGFPKLIFTLVWDGGGDNVLEQWPDSWPVLADLMRKGVSYQNATVGSSPSNTAPVHATIGTGAFPKTHGLPDTKVLIDGKILDSWQNHSPKFLEVETLADAWDRANGNGPLVGLLARDSWHVGMIGHGGHLSGADKDIAVLDDLGAVKFHTNEKFYSMPEYAASLEGLDEAITEVDRRDGTADGRWLGNPLRPIDGKIRYTPAWSIFQSQKIIELLRNEGFGSDDVPDLFFTNYKSTDLAGHTWNMVEPEVRHDLEEQDAQLEVILGALDKLVGRRNYVLVLSADHGMTPYPRLTGGWSINQAEMAQDIEREFDRTTADVELVLGNRGYQLYFDERELERNDVTPHEIARFVRNYRIEDNRDPGGDPQNWFEGRTDERVFLTALTPGGLRRAVACARERGG